MEKGKGKKGKKKHKLYMCSKTSIETTIFLFSTRQKFEKYIQTESSLQAALPFTTCSFLEICNDKTHCVMFQYRKISLRFALTNLPFTLIVSV
jgi:hypothetical protein